MLPPHCDPQGAFLIAVSSIFDTCIPSPVSFVAKAFGIISMMAWLCAQLPQVNKNYQNRSVEGLSSVFLAIWFAGDICNFTGAILLRQQFFQIAIGAYYVLIDTVLGFQFYWYGFASQRVAKPTHGVSVITKSDLNEGDDQTQPLLAGVDGSRDGRSAQHTGNWSLVNMVMGSLVLFSARASAHPIPAQVQTVLGSWDIGQTLGWTSCALYFSSRIPQICKNQARRSTDGLSPLLFMAALCGNFFYSASLLCNPLGWDDYPAYGGGGIAGPDGSVAEEWWRRSLPFFLGAWSVVIMDAIIGLQFWRWPANAKMKAPLPPLISEGEGQGLLSDVVVIYGAPSSPVPA